MTELRLAVQALSASAFSPYGEMLGKPLPAAGERPVFSNPATDFWQEHVFETGDGGEPEFLWVNYRPGMASARSLETHLLTQQAVVPLTGSIVQIVATSDADGQPDLSSLAAFQVRQGEGVCMRPGCWHTTRVPGDQQVTCLMLTRRSTTLDLIGGLNEGSPLQESALAEIPPVVIDLPVV